MSENQEKNDEQAAEEILDFSKPDFTFSAPGHHTYRQVGYYLVCKSCELQHAIWIGKNKIMVGVDEQSQPILKTRKELGMV